MLKAKDGDFFVTDWLRNRNTMEFLGVWERIYNPNFNYGEFATIRNQSGLNSFKISVKEFVARTGAISLQAKAGRYGGTYAHKDIAFEFAKYTRGQSPCVHENTRRFSESRWCAFANVIPTLSALLNSLKMRDIFLYPYRKYTHIVRRATYRHHDMRDICLLL